MADRGATWFFVELSLQEKVVYFLPENLQSLLALTGLVIFCWYWRDRGRPTSVVIEGKLNLYPCLSSLFLVYCY